METRIFKGQEELYQAAAEYFVNTACEAVNLRKKFSVAFCGGRTPIKLYELLATSPYREKVPWKHVNVFWTDEQWVYHNDLRNNAKVAFDLLLDHVPVPPQHICRISGELGPLDSAMQYECILQEYFKNEPPRLDMTFLNLGEDGQIAALIPGSEVLPEKNHWVKVVYHSEQKMYRITLTAHFINQARIIVFIVLGTEKASVIKRIFTGNNTHKLPAELIAPTDGESIFLLDEGAASEII